MNYSPTEEVACARTRSRLVGASCALALALSSGSALAAAPAAFTESATVKVQPSMAARPLAPARLQAARNEFEAFQVVVNGGETGLADLTARTSGLLGPKGATIPASAVSLYRVDLINVTTGSGNIGAPGQWPDALVPAVDEVDGQARNAFPFRVAANQSRAIWVDVLVPRDAAPGLYTGTVELSATGYSESVPFELEVWNFELPSTPTLRTAFLAFITNVCRKHLGTECSGNPEAVELVKKYARFALDHRITLPNIWAVKNIGADWSAFDATWGPLLDGTAQTRLQGAKLTTVQATWQQSAEDYRSLAAHFKARGWFDRIYDYTADEPPHFAPWESIVPSSKTVHAGDPGLQTLVTTNIDSANSNGITSSVDILVPLINQMETPKGGDQRPKYDAFVAGGKTLWMYQSCASHGCAFGAPVPGESWPSYMIDVPAMRNRLMQWANFNARVTGELYYETVLGFDGDPWTNQLLYSGNGDGNLFYPGLPSKIGGTTHVPVGSIRLKMIREGIEDFEYLTMVKNLGDPALADSVARGVLPKAYQSVDEPQRIVDARQRLAQRILELRPSSTPGPGLVEQPSSPAGGEVAGEGGGGGGGCSTTPGPIAAGVPVLALLGMVAIRRRRD